MRPNVAHRDDCWSALLSTSTGTPRGVTSPSAPIVKEYANKRYMALQRRLPLHAMQMHVENKGIDISLPSEEKDCNASC